MFDEVETVNKIPLIVAGICVVALIVLTYYFFGRKEIVETKIVVGEIGSKEEVKINEEVIVEISGAISEPGVYRMDGSARVVDLVGLAGGFAKEANIDWVSKKLNLSARLKDSQKIYIPFEWDNVESEEVEVAAFRDGDVKEEYGVEDKIDVNKDSKDKLMDLKGIGESYSQRIVDNRPYGDFYELVLVSGVPKGVLEKIKDQLSF